MSGNVELVRPHTPLRLADALKIAFPNGGMTVSGLRREIKRGRLVVETIANKQFVTLSAIEEMRRLCRVAPLDPGYGSNPPESGTGSSSRMRYGSSETAALNGALELARAKLALHERHKKPSPNTSSRSRQRPASATVIPLTSR